MEEIFIAIMERIAEKMPELSYIDEDYGQLEAGAEEDHYPVTFPCVLVGNAESDWNDLGYGVQKASHSSPYDWPLTATMTPTTPPEPMTR